MSYYEPVVGLRRLLPSRPPPPTTCGYQSVYVEMGQFFVVQSICIFLPPVHFLLFLLLAQLRAMQLPSRHSEIHVTTYIYIYIYIYIFDIREAADPSSTYVEYETRQPGLLGIFKRSNLSPAPPLLVRTHIQAVTGQALSHRDLRSFFCLIIRSWSLGLTSGNWTAAIDGTHCGKNGGKYWSHKGAS